MINKENKDHIGYFGAIFVKLLAIVPVILISGCISMVHPKSTLKAYDSERRGPNEVARIVGKSGNVPFGVGESKQIILLDVDQRMPNWKASPTPLKWVEVLPGDHTITAEVFAMTVAFGNGRTIRSIPESISFHAEAGRTYVVHGDYQLGPPETFLWIVEKDSGKIVAGEKH